MLEYRGGGNSAIDWAKDLIGIAKQITVIYRGESLSAHRMWQQVNPQRDVEYQYYLTTNGKGLTTVDGIYAVGDISIRKKILSFSGFICPLTVVPTQQLKIE